jgi:hypothetical protein
MSDKVDKVERMPYVILLALNKTKRIDMKISVDITGIANCPVRDANGNLLASVWTRNSVCNEFENATLLSREALEKHLKIFIDEGVKQNLAILPQVQDPAMVVDWVVKTAEFWERRYAEKRNEKYDISQNVLSVMFEVVFDTVAVVLQDYNFESFQQKLEERTKERSESMQENKYYRYIVTQFGKDMSADEINLETFFFIHRGHNALVRFLFRNDVVPGLRERLCILAGKLLQKKEVCNKAGMYSSRIQRSDIIQEYFYAQRDFQNWCAGQEEFIIKKLEEAINSDELLFQVVDHTAVNLSLSVIGELQDSLVLLPSQFQNIQPRDQNVHTLSSSLPQSSNNQHKAQSANWW